MNFGPSTSPRTGPRNDVYIRFKKQLAVSGSAGYSGGTITSGNRGNGTYQEFSYPAVSGGLSITGTSATGGLAVKPFNTNITGLNGIPFAFPSGGVTRNEGHTGHRLFQVIDSYTAEGDPIYKDITVPFKSLYVGASLANASLSCTGTLGYVANFGIVISMLYVYKADDGTYPETSPYTLLYPVANPTAEPINMIGPFSLEIERAWSTDYPGFFTQGPR